MPIKLRDWLADGKNSMTEHKTGNPRSSTKGGGKVNRTTAAKSTADRRKKNISEVGKEASNELR